MMNRLKMLVVSGCVSSFGFGASPLMAKQIAIKADEGRKEKAEIVKNKKTVEVCFVLDTTGSMSGLIEGAKQKIWSIASQIAQRQDSPKIRFSLVGYRDRGDKYITSLTDLNEDLDVVHDKLMKFKAAGGGDTPESVNQALNEAVTKVKWTEGGDVSRIIFLVGDAPPHMDYEQDVEYKTTCGLAKKKGIIINAIQCGNMTATIQPWQEIAKLGDGDYIALPQNGGVVAMSSPQDKRISELTAELNTSVIPYGNSERQLQAAWKLSNSLKMIELDVKMNAARAGCLSSHDGSVKAFLGDNDLVSEWGDKKVTSENIKQDYLPDDYKEMDKDKLVVLLENKIQQRAKIKTEMDALLDQREKYIAQEMAKMGKDAPAKAFDSNVEKMLKKQIK